MPRPRLSDFPPLPDVPRQFPTEPPMDVPLDELSEWWLRITCGCRGRRDYPLRLMAAKRGWKTTLGRVLPRLRCEKCGERPSSVVLISDPAAGARGNQTERGPEIELLIQG